LLKQFKTHSYSRYIFNTALYKADNLHVL